MRLVSRGYRHPGGPGHAASELLELRGQRCLDVGCGIGDDARAIAKAFDVHVVGIDQNPRTIEVALSRSAGFSQVTFQTAGASDFHVPTKRSMGDG